MKSILPLGLFILFFQFQSVSQVVIHHPDGSYYQQCSDFKVSRPLRELAKESPVKRITNQNEVIPEPNMGKISSKKVQANAAMRVEQAAADPVRQTAQGMRESAGPILNFDGQRSGLSPFDPAVAAGPNHVIQVINSQISIFDKSGNALLDTVSLGVLWPNATIDCDVNVLYDKFADRWFISLLAFDGSDYASINTLLIAVSSTNDPTQSYNTYTFVPTSGSLDYPKFSVWADGYYETGNLAVSQTVMVFNRDSMIAGNPNAGFVSSTFSTSGVSSSSPLFPGSALSASGWPNEGPLANFCGYTLNADGTLPPYGTPNYYIFFNDDGFGNGGADELVMYKFSVNWPNNTLTIAYDTALQTQPFNSIFPINGSFNHNGTLVPYPGIHQPGDGGTAMLDALPEFIENKVPYMRWTDHNSLVCCYAVNVGTANNAMAGIRWYELRQDLTTKAWSIYQQGTYAPNDGVNRWNSSISMDNNGNMGLAYTVSNGTNVYPGIRYTGRGQFDSLGIMSVAEVTAVEGQGIFNPNFRWGDYAQTCLDPDGVTFWHTNMYCGPGSSDDRTRIFSFQIASSTGIAGQKPALAKVVVFQNGTLLNVKASDLPASETVLAVELFTIEGKQLSRKTVNTNTGMFETTVDGSGFAKGIYLLRIGSSNFQKVVKISML